MRRRRGKRRADRRGARGAELELVVHEAGARGPAMNYPKKLLPLRGLTAGVRVRIKQPSTDLANEDGVVTRIDARGALLKLDSGRELLVEPEMLEVLA